MQKCFQHCCNIKTLDNIIFTVLFFLFKENRRAIFVFLRAKADVHGRLSHQVISGYLCELGVSSVDKLAAEVDRLGGVRLHLWHHLHPLTRSSCGWREKERVRNKHISASQILPVAHAYRTPSITPTSHTNAECSD